MPSMLFLTCPLEGMSEVGAGIPADFGVSGTGCVGRVVEALDWIEEDEALRKNGMEEGVRRLFATAGLFGEAVEATGVILWFERDSWRDV